MKEYTFSYYGWIPHYRDFDQDWITIQAEDEYKAWQEFNRLVKFYKSVGIESVREIEVNKN